MCTPGLMTAMNVRRLARGDEAAAVATLTEAFAADPLYLHLFSGMDERAKARRVHAFVSTIVSVNRWSGGLRWGVDAPGGGASAPVGRLAAVALAQQPGRGWARVRAALAGLRYLPLAFTLPFRTLRWASRFGSVAHRAIPRVPHHYLTVIGVADAFRGQRLASALLTSVIDACNADPLSQGVALDTENEHNVALYEHKGFELISRHSVDGLPVFCMFRPRDDARA